MSNRGSKHIPKSRAERDYYSRLIRQQDFEPTKMESLDFNESIDKDEDYSVPRVTKPRRRSISNLIGEHIKENAAGYLIALVLLILGYFMVDSKIDIATIKERIVGIDGKATRIEDDLDGMETKIDANYERLHQQEIKINRNNINIENLKGK